MEMNLEKLPFWDKLTGNEKTLVKSTAQIRKFATDELIHTCTKQCVGLVYVLSGNMRLFLLSEEGKEVTLLHIRENNSCVLAASCVLSQITFHSELIAAEETELLIIPAATLAQIIRDNIYIRCYMYETSTRLFSDVMWTIQQILFFSVDKRLASFLVEEAEKSNSSELCITQENIATEINTAREVVARMLKRFSNDGIIKLQRGKIIILDKESIEDIAFR